MFPINRTLRQDVLSALGKEGKAGARKRGRRDSLDSSKSYRSVDNSTGDLDSPLVLYAMLTMFLKVVAQDGSGEQYMYQNRQPKRNKIDADPFLDELKANQSSVMYEISNRRHRDARLRYLEKRIEQCKELLEDDVLGEHHQRMSREARKLRQMEDDATWVDAPVP